MAAMKKGFSIAKKTKIKSRILKHTTGAVQDVIDPVFEPDKTDTQLDALSNDVLTKDFQRRLRVETDDFVEDLNKAVEDSYLEQVNADEGNETYTSMDGNEEGETEFEQTTDSGPRRLFYGRAASYRNIYSDPKSQEDKNWNTWETFSAISGMNVSELVRKAEMGDLVLDGRELSRLQERFVSMQKMYKRQFYKCGERYVTPENIPNWSEECKKSNIRSQDLGDDTLNRKVALMHGDITTLEVDVVVNSVSSHLTDKHEGVSRAIVEAASTLVYYELESIWIIYVGEVEATAGYLLPAKYIFHTSGPTKHEEGFEQQLKRCYKSCLDKMVEMGLRTLAFPCIATGAKKMNARQAAQTALTTVKEWLHSNKDSVDKIIFCVYDIDNWACYQELMPEIFPSSDIIDTSEASLLPVEILRMDKKSIELYKRALSEGQEAVHNIRVMVVGHYGVGKTTLTKRLFGEDVDINQRESTNGIDVHVRRCKVSLETGEWKILDKDQENETVYHRLVKFLKMPVNETREIDGKETATGMDEGEDVVDGFIPPEEMSEDDNSANETNGKQALKEELTDKVPKPLQAETTALDDNAIQPKEEYILNHLKGFIEEVQHKVASEEDTNTADVSVWDFAGQYVFYATHQVFLSRRAVYLLVTDISKHAEDIVQDDDCFLDSKGANHWKISEFVDFWLNSIHEFCSSTESEGLPVLLVGTFADKLNQETKQETIDEFFYTLRRSLMHKETSCHLAEEDFALDNSIVDSNIEMLKDHIFNTAAKQPYWGELIPAKWITLENIIVSLKDQGLKVLHKGKLHDLNTTLPVPIETEEELDLFLRFHHESGNILYYSDDNLNDSIVLDPQWLIDAFKSLITAKMFCCRKPKIFEKWIQFDQSAILTRELVEAIWEKEENSVFHEHIELLLDYLEKLGFIAKPPQQIDVTEVTDYFFAPCVLKTSPPEDLLACNDCENRRSTSKLCFTTRSGFLPTAVFNKLLAACISKWPLTKTNRKHLIFCGCGIFDLKDNHILYVYFFDHVIQIWITKLSAKDQEPSTSLCSDAYAFVLDLLQNRLRLSSAMEVFIRSQCSDLHSHDNMFPVDEIAQNPEVVCSCRTEKHVLRTNELLKYWHLSKADHQQKVPTDKDINRMAHHIGKEYQSLGLELGLSQAEIDHINLDSKTTVDRIREMLMKWKEKEEGEATLEMLTNAMEVVGIDAQVVLQSAKISI
ncbi:uncharacterized protein LOC123537873 [Mercenaria mercenaria]|uniref:uncharacterized protein LOC123537873 n=1 Tax=Mercenaria mercenaria TaxID=6596 RepID=UPI00234F6BB1|nr:uncharacterized protein LOC123537873 [Mercenaria mercenaria]